jgi:DNA polymerase
MADLNIDIETYSDRSLKHCGVYKYTESPEFKILLFAYAYDSGPVVIIDLANGERLPKKVAEALVDPRIRKTAFNAQFERVCINKYFAIKSVNWDCTQVLAARLGFAGDLASVGAAVGIDPDEQKLWTGKNLIRLFCIPRKITSGEQGKLFKPEKKKKVYTREERPKEWEQFKDYCARDVIAERSIRQKLERFLVIPEKEVELYELDQKINDTGILIDIDLAQKAVQMDQEQTEILTEEFRRRTGLKNPNSLVDIKALIKARTGKVVPSITKHNQADLMEAFKEHPDIVYALEVRQRLSKTSIAKYQKMLDVVGDDGRARGILQFYGAARTGRWAGRSIQPQNLPQNHIKDLDTARKILKTGDLELLEMMYEDPSDILSQCIRTAIIPPPGSKFVVADFSAIEARVIAWLSGEQWRIDVFNSHGKIYEASAASMFKVPIESIHKGDPLRQKGKVAELACGYGGGAGALIRMGAGDLSRDELKTIVTQWRAANPKITQFWHDTENAAREAIIERSTVPINKYVKAIYQSGILFIELPSGRRLAYVKPKLAEDERYPGKEKITFQAVNEKTWQWEEEDTYGGKLVENIVQATARDCLAHAMWMVDYHRFKIVMHVHDEIVVEVAEDDHDSLNTICSLLGEPISWAPGLSLKADGYECFYYQKD